MKRPALTAIAVALALSPALPMLAHAADGYLTDNVDMMAGPDPGYPLIAQMPAGTEVDVQGCTAGWEWCDVIAYGNRGWVGGNYIQYDYGNQQVLLPYYGAQIGIPIVGFSIGAYWDRYYRGRPFYGERQRWYHQPFAHRPPPPPVGRPYPGPIHGGPAPVRPPVGNPHPGYPGYGRPGHLGPVTPGHPVWSGQGTRPQPYGQAHPQPSGRPADANRSRPAPKPRNDQDNSDNGH